MHKGSHQKNKSHCPQNHPYDESNTYVNPTTGYRSCRICMRDHDLKYKAAYPDKIRENARARQQDNPDRLREFDLKRLYGISLDEYNAMLEAQDGRCVICRRLPGKKRLSVDHNHETGLVRGLLCNRCNLGLGTLGDDHETLTAAEIYMSQEAPKSGLNLDYGLPEGFVSISVP
ncbi:hypothetical protein LCGC14_2492820 [marine sediment metagenome]|uniref:Recombination endonuclease VII n=1 Tax=marine sediment metagenome TaxID=412755 RepID=A0A0F9BS88_9ZZZZ